MKKDSVQKGIVFDIKEFAVFDGPGIRTTVFMKGCPLRCKWCHNPEGLKKEPELMVSTAACVHCGACLAVCRHPKGCVACSACIPVCRGGFRRIIGEEWTADALAERLNRDRDIYCESGGGVTFSGGEPLLQWAFVRAVFERLRDVHKAIETSGYTPDDIFAEAMQACDLIMMDWKLSDPETLKEYTGASMEPILKHINMLAAGKTSFILRMPVIPGVNDNRKHFETVAALVGKAKNLIRVEVLPYQRAAGAKYGMVGRTYAPPFDEEKKPEFFTEGFEEDGIPYRIFK